MCLDDSIDATLLLAVGEDLSFNVCNQSNKENKTIELTFDDNNKKNFCNEEYAEKQNNSSVCVESTITEEPDCLGLNKKIHLEDVNWHVNRISQWRPNCGKNQFKVHYKSVHKKKYPP